MKPGPKPKGKVKLLWSPRFAYAIGLLVADGCLSKDGRHIDLTSKDKAQILTFRKCLDLDTKVSTKYSGAGNLAYHIQFSDVLFYKFLFDIGLTPAKSKTISVLTIPDKYFFDFLRGYFDGDGSSYAYSDPVFGKSFRFYLSFTSASPQFVVWLKAKVSDFLQVTGYLSYNKNNSYVQLKYAKKDAVLISKAMYYDKDLPFLKRKYLKIQKSLDKISRSGETGIHATFRA